MTTSQGQGYFRNDGFQHSNFQNPPPSWSNQQASQHESYPSHHPLANLELGPGFGPNAANTKMATLPPPPASQEELRELIEKRMKLEMIHPYEKHLIESFDGNSKNTPQMHPPPEYLRLVRDRAILKVRLLRAQERSFDVYGTATQMFTQGTSNANDPYGFEANGKVEERSGGLADSGLNLASLNNGGSIEQQPPSSSYATAYSNSMAGGPMMKKEFVPRRAPY